MDDIQAIANERDNLMQILAAVRVALRTPEDVDIVAHAQAVAAKAAKWDGVPWRAVESLLISWQIGRYADDDDVADLLSWYDANRVQVTR